MVNYKLTKRAVDDLSEIWLYTFETWSERQADKYYSLLIDTEYLKSFGYPRVKKQTLIRMESFKDLPEKVSKTAITKLQMFIGVD